jgi:hypothetical protein
VVYQPSAWYDGHDNVEGNGAVFRQPFLKDSHPAQHLTDMDSYLQAFEAEKAYNYPRRPPQVPDAEAAHRFWHSMSETRRVLNGARERGQIVEQGE